MLAFAVRGVVLLSVLSWYSATVWKMIDGYFKDQFHTYLKEEYDKYPQMKADIENVEAVDKRSVSNSLPAESIPSHSVDDSYGPDTACPADITDTCQQYAAVSSEWKSTTEAVTAGGTNENAAAVDAGSIDKNSFLVLSELESKKSLSSSSDVHDEKGRTSTIIHQGNDRKQTKSEKDNGVLTDPTSLFQRREKLRRRSETKAATSDHSKKISKKMLREKSKKQRIKTIVLTNAGAKITNDGDDDFSEFEEEERRENKRVSKEGILVTELPFKPKVDISGLDRVSAEEFCPLALENEASCEETTTWPWLLFDARHHGGTAKLYKKIYALTAGFLERF